MLPAQLLVRIGIYVQTAAHLELAVWQILMQARNVDEHDGVALRKHLEIKKTTPKLIAELKDAAKDCPPNISLRISMLAEKIEQGLENRNLVAHGAFFVENSNENIHVAHFFPRGKGKERQWFQIDSSITERAAKNAIEEIDTLLREAISIRDMLTESKSS
ncbi:MAG: hypothetical protein GC146_04045 [Limimaricola sp.]|uniref:hypothetical protein n=1 Tax=Limimaricola sp. TaxID=2211665 RepID=UPI001E138A39|nr:hypothetical protein [Limimaricola sp.]MBI1416373.1 hypothetical protein [Limimaricola sp.]